MNDLHTAALARQALEALESVYGKGKRCEAAITVLRRALEQPAQHSASVFAQNTSNSLETTNQEAQDEPVAWTDEQLQMLNFLYGAGEFDGVWFDEKHPTEKAAFWWRKHLRRLFDTSPQSMTPLTDEQKIKAVLWDLAVNKGLISVHTEKLASGWSSDITKVSWLEGHDKACDISNEAAHGITGEKK